MSNKEDTAAPPPFAYQTYVSHDQQEQAHWEEVCLALRQYATFAQYQWINQRCRLNSLPESQRKLLPQALQKGTPESRKRASLHKDAAIRNQICLDAILNHAGIPTSQQVSRSSQKRFASDTYVSKVSSVLKSLYREWSSEGRIERDMSHKFLLQDIQDLFPLGNNNSGVAPKLCVPGSGIGRLALELASMGYNVQGNEFSLLNLLASDFVLNGGVCNPNNPLTISPWLLETRNVHSASDPYRKVDIPDVDPYSMLAHETGKNPGELSMAAGEFISIYNNQREHNKWDGIVCCFFLDTAANMVEYLQVMYDMLKEGGVLVNFGPFLHSWSGPAMRPDDKSFVSYQRRHQHFDSRYLSSIDLCWEDVREILVNVGFEIEEEQTGHRALFTADRKSMMNMAYRGVHFVARKARRVEPVRTLG